MSNDNTNQTTKHDMLSRQKQHLKLLIEQLDAKGINELLSHPVLINLYAMGNPHEVSPFPART